MTAKIIVKCIIFNRALNRFLLVQRCENDHTGANISDIEIKKIAYVSILEGELLNLLIVYLCETATKNVTVSFEHQAYVWADEAQCRELLPKAIIRDFEKNHVFDILQKT